ncbi:hypothetical protein Mkiyose1384_09360 [Mycobacterium kiyosense]|uniref:Uncharacterized protein n=1 Tax=Mycobacterium kiyosense TaxID=2871094 RepID=A0A9P3UYG2_9MYCO|nr:hypothetical protein IWGMT90018_38990 [Mycobacterium kiyosense]GLB94758.1 hypothetical protein SRL2020226_15340 [Mycobacterium kiyosense]GLD10715.1 hypothetical protein Mkiyose1384_09360 [Mycobacterium kiyosense]GLD16864.1 hypothetical protein Mkiyose1385_09630 [Mycobacterium kiyosense]GLD22924.1 hypothetical protein Mkiyose1386_09170 [Mycobacterium kiyosense]
MREVDDDLRATLGQQAQLVARVYRGRQRQIVGRLDGTHHRRADLALGPQHAYPHGLQPTVRDLGWDRSVCVARKRARTE